MAKFTKKPVTIEATQWFKNGDHPLDYPAESVGAAIDWEGAIVRRYRHPDVAGDTVCKHCGNTMHNHGWIDTLEGGHIVCPGDWVITGVAGERYPCKNEIFKATYSADAGAMDFGAALAALKAGKKIAREGWNGKDMWIGMHAEGGTFVREECGTELTYRDYIVMKTVDNQLVPWTASQTDVLAKDWVLVD